MPLSKIQSMAYVFCGNMLAGAWPRGKAGEKLAKQMAALQAELIKRGERPISPLSIKP